MFKRALAWVNEHATTTVIVCVGVSTAFVVFVIL
jgi:hypothetical protein